MHHHRGHAFAAFLMPGHAVAARCPQAAAFPAGFGIVDAAVETFGIEAGWVRQLHDDHLSVRISDQAVIEIAGGDRHVIAEAERVVLIDPGVIARLGAVIANARKARAWIFVERPALGAVIARGLRSVERTFALAPV